jgi:methylenetetrahydrofolate dehydrogenase (NADP+) / methenyltetrahydrofolate cyclohydrolase
MQLINGYELAQKIYDEISPVINKLSRKPRLAIILANNSDASKTYIKMKMKKADELGIAVDLIRFDETSNVQEVLNKIKSLNDNPAIDGILVQLPLFEDWELFRHQIFNTINPLKDPDGLSAINAGLVSQSVLNGIIPATVDAVLECIKFSGAKLEGANVLVINNTDLIGKPLGSILATLNSTVTIANKHTKDLDNLISKADIVVSATGATNIIRSDNVKSGAVIVDVTSIKKDAKVIGDLTIDEKIEAIDGFITPVPGGVGPLTIACLLRNLVTLSKAHQDE